MTRDWRSVPLPPRMRPLQRDGRGLPVPYVVLRDLNNKPYFAANDGTRIDKCIKERRCAICGGTLDRLFWFVGGPGSAFDPDGWYLDTAMHHACMVYALRVCPYLAMPSYTGRVDDKTIDYQALPAQHQTLVDYTIDPARPKVFVAVGSTGQETRRYPLQAPRVRPKRPYASVEFWHGGERLPRVEGTALALESLSHRPERPWMNVMFDAYPVGEETVSVFDSDSNRRLIRWNAETVKVFRRYQKTVVSPDNDEECYLVTDPKDMAILAEFEIV